MMMRIKIACPSSPSTDSALRWDLAYIAAGLQTGYRGPEFLRDLHALLEQRRHKLRVLQLDQLPDRHAAFPAYLIRRAALPHYSRHGGQPEWLKDARRERQALLREGAQLRSRGMSFDGYRLEENLGSYDNADNGSEPGGTIT